MPSRLGRLLLKKTLQVRSADESAASSARQTHKQLSLKHASRQARPALCYSSISIPRTADGSRGLEGHENTPAEHAPAYVGDGHARRLTEMAAVCLPPGHTRSTTRQRPWAGRAESSGRAAPRVAMRKPAKARSSGDFGGWMRFRLHGSHRGRILPQGQVLAVVEVVRGDAGRKALQVFLVRTRTWSRKSRRAVLTNLSASAFCQGLRAVIASVRFPCGGSQ